MHMNQVFSFPLDILSRIQLMQPESLDILVDDFDMDCKFDVSTLKAMEDNPMGSQLHPEVNDRKVDQEYAPLMEDMQIAQVPYSSSMTENSNAQPVSSKINDISTEQEIQILKQMAQGRKTNKQGSVT